MWKQILLFSILVSIQSKASSTYQISGIRPYLRDGVYLLKNKTPHLIVLDCSSFLHNLSITANQEEQIHYLTVQECSDFYDFFKKFNPRRKCLTNDQSEIIYHPCH